VSEGVYLSRIELAALLAAVTQGAIGKLGLANLLSVSTTRACEILERLMPSHRPDLAHHFRPLVAKFSEHPARSEWMAIADSVITIAEIQGEASKRASVNRRCPKCGTPYPALLLEAVDAEVRKAVAGGSKGSC